MNIFDLSFVEVTKIINAKKLVFKTGARSSSKEWRNKYDGNEHGYYSLSFTIGGEAEYHIGKKTLLPHENCVMFLDNYSPFNYKIIQDHKFYVINFVANQGFIQAPNMFIPEDPKKYLALFNEACTYYKHKAPGYLMMTTSILLKILALIREEDYRTMQEKSKLNKIIYAIDYIQENISNPALSVEGIASHVGNSGTHLRSLFLKEVGISPNKYIKNLRIGEACKLFITSNYTVSEVAVRCGFCDTSYFCKEFNKIMGCTPHVYKRNRNG